MFQSKNVDPLRWADAKRQLCVLPSCAHVRGRVSVLKTNEPLSLKSLTICSRRRTQTHVGKLAVFWSCSLACLVITFLTVLRVSQNLVCGSQQPLKCINMEIISDAKAEVFMSKNFKDQQSVNGTSCVHFDGSDICRLFQKEHTHLQKVVCFMHQANIWTEQRTTSEQKDTENNKADICYWNGLYPGNMVNNYNKLFRYCKMLSALSHLLTSVPAVPRWLRANTLQQCALSAFAFPPLLVWSDYMENHD